MLIKQLLKKEERFDNRKLLEKREISVEEGEEDENAPIPHSGVVGSYLLSSGDSKLLVSYQMTITAPYSDNPKKGIVSINVYNENLRRIEKYNNILNKIFLRGKFLNQEMMCIKAFKEVYNLSIEMKILREDGNMYNILVEGLSKVGRKLGILSKSILGVFYYVSIENCLLSDPIGMEEEEKDWGCLVVMKSLTEIVYLEKSGGVCKKNEFTSALMEAFSEMKGMWKERLKETGCIFDEID